MIIPLSQARLPLTQTLHIQHPASPLIAPPIADTAIAAGVVVTRTTSAVGVFGACAGAVAHVLWYEGAEVVV